MKKSISTLLFILLVALNVHAQDTKKEQIKSLKIAYITDALQLDSPSAERLWPVYNKYEQRYMAVREQRKAIVASYKNKLAQKTLTEAEAERYITQLGNLNAQLTNLEQQRMQELSKTIGAVRTLQLKRAENEFHKDLVKKVSKTSN